jgi:hypothetical protein
MLACGPDSAARPRGVHMLDIIMLATCVAFFGLMLAYSVACDRL